MICILHLVKNIMFYIISMLLMPWMMIEIRIVCFRTMHLKRWPSIDDNTIHPVDYAYGLWFVVFLLSYASQFIKIFNPVTTQRANYMIVPMPVIKPLRISLIDHMKPLGTRLNIKIPSCHCRNTLLKIKRSHDRLTFNMGIPIPGKGGLYIDTGLCILTATKSTAKHCAY